MRREAEVIDPQQRIMLECAWEALEDAGYDSLRYDGLIGVYAGATLSHYLLMLHPQKEFRRSLGIDQMTLSLGNFPELLTTRIAHKLHLRGPAVSVQTACSTSLVAVHRSAPAPGRWSLPPPVLPRSAPIAASRDTAPRDNAPSGKRRQTAR